MSKIELGKTYRTRDGREVRVYAVDGGDMWPVHGAVVTEDGQVLVKWSADGRYGLSPSDWDLIEVKPRIRHSGWSMLYPDTENRCRLGYLYPTREEAIRNTIFFARPIACIPLTIDCEEGEGL